jgi:cell division protein FtsL
MKKTKSPFTIIIIVIISAFIYVWQQTHSVKMDYQISQLDSQYKKLLDQKASLNFRKNSILSVEKMDKIAQEKKLKRASVAAGTGSDEIVVLTDKK